jgi:transposase
MPKKINPEVKARAVRLVTEHRQEYPSVTAAAEAVSKQLGLGRETVRRWMVQADVDAGRRDGVTSEELEEIKKLKFENRQTQGVGAALPRSEEVRCGAWGISNG